MKREKTSLSLVQWPSITSYSIKYVRMNRIKKRFITIWLYKCSFIHRDGAHGEINKKNKKNEITKKENKRSLIGLGVAIQLHFSQIFYQRNLKIIANRTEMLFRTLPCTMLKEPDGDKKKPKKKSRQIPERNNKLTNHSMMCDRPIKRDGRACPSLVAPQNRFEYALIICNVCSKNHNNNNNK